MGGKALVIAGQPVFLTLPLAGRILASGVPASRAALLTTTFLKLIFKVISTPRVGLERITPRPRASSAPCNDYIQLTGESHLPERVQCAETPRHTTLRTELEPETLFACEFLQRN